MSPLPPDVVTVIESYPNPAQARFKQIRAMIHEEAGRLSAGPLTETLKWGEPAFLTGDSGAGTTIRLAWKAKDPDVLRLLVHCQTSLVEAWRARFPGLTFEGNRALVLPLKGPLPEAEMRTCLAMALTYHRTPA